MGNSSLTMKVRGRPFPEHSRKGDAMKRGILLLITLVLFVV